MIETKPKKCKGIGKAISVKGCGEMYLHRTYGLCSNCLADFLFGTDCGQLILRSKVIPKAKEKVKKESKAKDKVARDKLKTLSQYEAEAKKSFQKFIRLRDANENCISCGTNHSDIWDGGHFKKAEIYSGVIFDEQNCRKQCAKCNRFLGGNELNYRSGLITRIGEESVLELEKRASDSRQYKFTKDELISIKKKYDLKIKELSNKPNIYTK